MRLPVAGRAGRGACGRCVIPAWQASRLPRPADSLPALRGCSAGEALPLRATGVGLQRVRGHQRSRAIASKNANKSATNIATENANKNAKRRRMRRRRRRRMRMRTNAPCACPTRPSAPKRCSLRLGETLAGAAACCRARGAEDLREACDACP